MAFNLRAPGLGNTIDRSSCPKSVERKAVQDQHTITVQTMTGMDHWKAIPSRPPAGVQAAEEGVTARIFQISACGNNASMLEKHS
jgi:hypothetical protein